MPPLRIWQLVFLESSLMGNDSRSYLAHQSLPQGWLHHMLQDRRGDTINSFIPGWEHVRFLPASQKFVSSPVEVVSTKKIRKVSCGILWWYTFWGIRVSYLLAKREIPQFCLEKWREQMVSFWPSRPLSDQDPYRNHSQPKASQIQIIQDLLCKLKHLC